MPTFAPFDPAKDLSLLGTSDILLIAKYPEPAYIAIKTGKHG